MAAEQEFDDLLRSKLANVQAPRPPAMDWSAMARAAQAGHGVTPSAASITSRALVSWKLIIGLAACLAVGGYVAITSEKAELPALAVDPPVTRSDDDPTLGYGPSANLGTTSGDVKSYAGREIALHHTSVAEIPLSTVPVNKVPPTVSTGASNSATDNGINSNGSALEARSVVVNVAPVGEGPSLPSTVAVPSGPDALPMNGPRDLGGEPIGTTTSATDAVLMEGRQWLPTPPALFPVQALAQRTDRAIVPRLGLSPWLLLGRPIHSAAPGAVADQVDALGSLSNAFGAVGLRVEYAFSLRLAMLSGLQYASKGKMRGSIDTAGDVRTDYNVSGRYWEIPLGLKYSVPLEGKEFYLRGGALLQINAGVGDDRVVMHDRGLKEISTLALSSRSMGVALEVGAGVRFRLGRGFGLFVEPSYQHGLSPVVKNSAFDRLPYNPKVHGIGLGAGLTFQLRSK